MSADVGRLTRLLPLACLVAAICLFASELMTTFDFTPPGGEVLRTQGGAGRHGNALMVIAVFAIGALAVAVLAASKPAATAVAIAGVVALLVFLLVDLPDANAVGTLDDARESFFDAEAVPQGGFFLEMAAALALAVTGVALATLSPQQLAALRPGGRDRGDRGARGDRGDRGESSAGHESSADDSRGTDEATARHESSAGAGLADEKPDPHRGVPRRRRTRQRG
ncbi:MAG: hypothetical protein GEU88_11315 [Solirubrobacterales bacterium]|nr:hypothetical protein [Solirubrobacterales bacterium]